MSARPIDRPTVLLRFLTFVLACALVAGCHSDKATAPLDGAMDPASSAGETARPDARNQATPEDCLQSLRLAYQSRNLDDYRKLFAGFFTFVFNPEDVYDPSDPTPPFWGLGEELIAAHNMFFDDTVDSIRVQFTLVPPVPVPGDPNRTVRVQMNNVYLAMYTRTEAGEPLVYLVEDSTQQFYLRPFLAMTETRQRVLWKIVRWEDLGVTGSRTETLSWGRVKFWFR